MVGGQFLAVEDPDLAGLDIGRGDEQLDLFAGAHLGEIDHLGEVVAQRIEVQRVEFVGTGIMGDEVHPPIGGEPS